MLQMKMTSGGTEKIMDLIDVPDFVLTQSFEMMFRNHDVNDPDIRNYLRDIATALKTKAEKRLADGTSDDEYYCKKYIAELDGMLEKLA